MNTEASSSCGTQIDPEESFKLEKRRLKFLVIYREVLLRFFFRIDSRGPGNRKFFVAQRGWRAQLASRWRDAVLLRDTDISQLSIGARGRRRRRRQSRRQQPRCSVPLPILRQDVPAAQLSEEARTGKDDNCFLDHHISQLVIIRYCSR